METKDNAVLYVDAGYMHKSSTAGWGLHGYTYNESDTKRGSGNPKALPTALGYSDDKENLVNVTNYVDGCGPIPKAKSSTEAELLAAIKALEWSTENDVHKVTIRSDSKNVVDGATSWMKGWKKNNWVKSDGNAVKSKEHWQRVDDLHALLESQNKEVKYLWVKGHNGEFGNETTDQYARIGNSLSMRGSDYTYTSVKTSVGYWNPKVTHNRMLSNGKWYYSTIDRDYVKEDGKHIYYIGDHGKEDEMYGKPITSASLTVLLLNEADPVLETYRNLSIELDNKDFGSVMIGYMSNILNKFQYAEVQEHGSALLDYNTKRRDITTGCHKKKMLVLEQNPPKLAYQAVETIKALEKRLNDYLSNEDGFIIVNDVTDQFYELNDKKKNVLKKSVSLTMKTISLKSKYNTDKRGETVKTADKYKDIKMILGRDLPLRNTLNHLVDVNPKIEVITWRESDKAIRYATVLTTDLGIGIWAGVYSNFLLV